MAVLSFKFFTFLTKRFTQYYWGLITVSSVGLILIKLAGLEKWRIFIEPCEWYFLNYLGLATNSSKVKQRIFLFTIARKKKFKESNLTIIIFFKNLNLIKAWRWCGHRWQTRHLLRPPRTASPFTRPKQIWSQNLEFKPVTERFLNAISLRFLNVHHIIFQKTKLNSCQIDWFFSLVLF